MIIFKVDATFLLPDFSCSNSVLFSVPTCCLLNKSKLTYLDKEQATLNGMPVSTALQLITVASGKLHYLCLASTVFSEVKEILYQYIAHMLCAPKLHKLHMIDLDLYM